MSEHIEPKPTEYRSVKFHSRLEARWAVFFDYYHLVAEWIYEPCTLKLSNGWEYTPDFRISFSSCPLFIEIKPVDVTEEYHHVLTQFASNLRASPLILCVGDFYKPASLHLENMTLQSKYPKFSQLLPQSEEAAEIARNYRFDIPYTPPAFRRGSEESFKRIVAEQQAALRRKARKKRNR